MRSKIGSDDSFPKNWKQEKILRLQSLELQEWGYLNILTPTKNDRIAAGPNNEEKKASTQVLKGDNNSFDNWQ